uniref:Uncharacterized protein n=1 Tax=Rhizophora mucronata TaxID=61149 RepID=A0A2P2NFK1_RHIMU
MHLKFSRAVTLEHSKKGYPSIYHLPFTQYCLRLYQLTTQEPPTFNLLANTFKGKKLIN